MKDRRISTYILLSSLFSLGLSQLRFDTNFDTYTNEYIAEEGDTVSLLCTPSQNGAHVVSIYQVSYDIYDRRQVYHYPLERTGRVSTANIGPLTVHDSTRYICAYSYWRCHPWWWCREFINYFSVNLYVIPSTGERNCSLVNETNGIFFINDSLTLRCNSDIPDGFDIFFIDVNKIYTYDEGELRTVDDEDTGTTLWTIPRLIHVLDNASMACGDDADKDGNGNYCSNVRPISVFASFEVTVSPEELRVPNRGNATLTCTSELLFLAFFSEWNYLWGEVTFANTSMSVDPEGIHLTLTDIDFTNSTSGRLTVSCNVTVGSRSVATTTTIYEQNILTTVAASTTLTTDGGISEEASPNNSTNTAAVISVSVGGILVFTVTIFALAWCFKLSRRSDATSKGTGAREEQLDAANAGNPSQESHLYERSIANVQAVSIALDRNDRGLTEDDRNGPRVVGHHYERKIENLSGNEISHDPYEEVE